MGSSMQIALFVIPVLVLLGWCIGQPLSLDFQVFECVTVFLAVILANTVISEGKSHWMQGLVVFAAGKHTEGVFAGKHCPPIRRPPKVFLFKMYTYTFHG